MVLILLTSIIALSSCGNNDTSICSACGAENSADVKFCSNCGNAFDNVENNGNNNGNPNNNGNQNNNGEASISTAEDLLNEIASNTTISLSNVTLNFDNITEINNSCVERGDDSYYVIKNVENLTILGDKTTVSFVSNLEMIYFLKFENCKNISISNISFISNNYDYGYGLVSLSFEDCDATTVKNCNFEKLGTGVDFYNCGTGVVENCNFNDLDSGAVSTISSNISVNKCNIKDSENVFYCCKSTFNVTECDVSGTKSSNVLYDNTASVFSGTVYDESNITFNNCEFKNNTVNSFFAKTVLGEKNDEYDIYDSTDVYEHNKLIFKNCKFNNNIYCYGSLSSSNYNSCTFSNNKKGIDVWDFSGWEFESAIELLEGINYTIEYLSEDVEADCLYSSAMVTSQSDYGIVDASKRITLYVSQPAISIQEISIDVNSANGVEPSITFTNHTDKQIAYIYFTIKFYDRMGSPAYCSIRDTHTRRLKVTGPINAGEQDTRYWDPVIYNGATAAMKPLKIEIEFTDGSKQTITCINGRYWYMGSYYGGELKD